MRNLSAFAVFALLLITSGYGQTTKPTPSNDRFLLPVADAFQIAGRGTVVAGTIQRGTVKVGDSVELIGIGPNITASVTGIEANRKPATEAKKGENVALVLRGVALADVKRGQVIAELGSIKGYHKFRAKIDLLATADGGRRFPFRNEARSQFQFWTADMTGKLRLPPGVESIEPGKSDSQVEIELVSPLALEVGQKFAIREAGRTIGSGVVVELTENSLP